MKVPGSAGKGSVLLLFATFLVGLVLIVAFVWLPGETEHPKTTPGPSSSTSFSEPGGRTAPRTGVASDRGTPTPSRGGGEPTKSEPERSRAERPTRVLVKGEVVGPRGHGQGPADIQISALGLREWHRARLDPSQWFKPRSMKTRAGKDGKFVADVTSLFTGGIRDLEVLIRVDDPDFLPATRHLRMRSDAHRHGSDAVYHVRIALADAAVITGVVEDENSRPVSFATVSNFPTSGPRRQATAFDTAFTDAAGRYRLRGEAMQSNLVVAVKRGLVPAMVHVTPVERVDTFAPHLVLETGPSISGHLTMNGAPVIGGKVGASLARKHVEFKVGSFLLALERGKPVMATLSATTDSVGRYELGGLGALSYRVQVESLPGDVLVMPGLARRLAKSATAPAKDVDIDIAGASLEVTVLGTAGPIEGAAVTVSWATGTVTTTTNKDGKVHLLGQPDSRAYLSVSAKGYKGKFRDVLTEGRGEDQDEIVTLEPVEKGSTLVVMLVAPQGKTVDQAGFGFYPEGSAGGEPTVIRDVTAEGRLFPIHGLRPGTWEVVVRAGGGWYSGGGYWIRAQTKVVIPTSGATKSAIRIRRGGRLRIEAKNEKGERLAARCVIRRDGRTVPNVILQTQVEHGVSESSTHLSDKGPSETATALPAGHYDVELSLAGYRSVTQKVELTAGKTTTVSAKLEHP